MFSTRTRTAPAVAAFVLFAAVALAGCGAGSGSDVASIAEPSPTGSAEPDATAGDGDPVAFAECMREHGVDVPDPKSDEDGAVQFSLPRNPDDKAMTEAMAACRKHLPNGGAPQRLDPEELAQARAFAKCMRENGIEEFPDPDPDGGLLIEGDEITVDDEFVTAQEACSEFLPGTGEVIG